MLYATGPKVNATVVCLHGTSGSRHISIASAARLDLAAKFNGQFAWVHLCLPLAQASSPYVTQP